ncbi:unnamed protein product, partial [Chrysoparadoxa australica]
MHPVCPRAGSWWEDRAQSPVQPHPFFGDDQATSLSLANIERGLKESWRVLGAEEPKLTIIVSYARIAALAVVAGLAYAFRRCYKRKKRRGRKRERSRGFRSHSVSEARSKPLRFQQEHRPRTFGDELLFGGAQNHHFFAEVAENTVLWMDNRRQRLTRKLSRGVNKLKLDPGKGDGLKDLYHSSSGISAVSPASEGKRLAGQAAPSSLTNDFGLTPDALFAFEAIMELEVFGAAQVPVLASLCRGAQVRPVAAGEVIQREGQVLTDLQLLVDGEVEAITDAEHQLFRAVRKGTLLWSLLDLMGLIVQGKPQTCVELRALTACKILSISNAGGLLKEAVERRRPIMSELLFMILIKVNRVTLLTSHNLGMMDGEPRPDKAQMTAHPNEASPPSISHLSSSEVTSVVHALVARSFGLLAEAPDHHASLGLPPVKIVDGNGAAVADVCPVTTRRGSMFAEVDIVSSEVLEPLELHTFNKDEEVLGEVGDDCCVVVMSGELLVRAREQPLHLFKKASSAMSYTERHVKGSIVGQMSLLTGTRREWYGGGSEGHGALLRITASCTTQVVKVYKFTHDQMIRRHPEALLAVCNRLLLRMPALLKQFDFGARYINLSPGEVVVREGECTDSLAIILHGRLQGVLPTRSGSSVLNFSRGMMIGEAEVMSGGTNWCTIKALRQSSLAQVPASLLAYFAGKKPGIIMNLAKHAVDKKRSHLTNREHNHRRTFMVVPISGSVPLGLFCTELEKSIRSLGQSCKVLTRGSLTSNSGLSLGQQGETCQEGFLSLALGSWLAAEEEQHEVILYQADWIDSTWNRLLVQQCDRVLLVGNAADPPFPSKLEEALDLNVPHTSKHRLARAPASLILLHVDPPAGYRPTNTRAWIELRVIDEHHHLRSATAAAASSHEAPSKDFLRLGRCLTGKAVGLVLGGGGARGMAHLGVIRCLEEEKIPIDMLAGTSIGSFVGACYAMHPNFIEVNEVVTAFAAQMGTAWNYLKDITLPITSYLSGYGFNMVTKKSFGETKIEDLWLNYRCITTDLSSCSERCHKTGTLWRYVRASMSLAGFLPPVCDEDQQTGQIHYLVDGGYCNNLPADVMKREMGAEVVIACDVGGAWTFGGANYGDNLSGLWVLFKTRLWLFGKLKIPSMADISEQLAFMSSVKQLREAEELADLYLKPPVDHITTLDFQKHVPVRAIGYSYAREMVPEWKGRMLRQGCLVGMQSTLIKSKSLTALLR